MKMINQMKYLVGKKKLGKGKTGAKGGIGKPTGAFGGKSKFNKKLEKNSWLLTNNRV